MSDFKAKMHQIVWIFGGILLREVRGGDPLLSRYTPIHYILDKDLGVASRMDLCNRGPCLTRALSEMPAARDCEIKAYI